MNVLSLKFGHQHRIGSLPQKSFEHICLELVESRKHLFSSKALYNMDFTRNMSSVQHVQRVWSPMDNRTDMNEKRRSRTGLRVEGGEDEVICPRPRRPTTVNCPVNEFVEPSHRHRSKSSARSEGVVCFELLDIFLNKGGYRGVSNFSSSPPSFCGSPPSRAGNPLIHDAAFLHQRTTSNLSLQMNSCGPSSHSAKPTVRIEGFGSFGSQVSALA